MLGRISMLAALSVMLLSAESGGAPDGGAGGGGGAPPAPPAQPSVDAGKVKAEARAAALRELGFDSEDAYKAHLDEKKKAEEARLSEAEKRDRALKDALDTRGKLEADLRAARARERELEEQLVLRDKLDKRGVPSGERRVVEVLLDDAQRDAKSAGKGFDEDAFFAKLEAERPYLFAKGGQVPANTSHRVPPPSPYGGNIVPQGHGQVDALRMSEAEYLAWRNSQPFGRALSA